MTNQNENDGNPFESPANNKSSETSWLTRHPKSKISLILLFIGVHYHILMQVLYLVLPIDVSPSASPLLRGIIISADVVLGICSLASLVYGIAALRKTKIPLIWITMCVANIIVSLQWLQIR